MQDIARHILVEAARGDIGAFRRIYMYSSDFVYNIAYRVTGNREDAEEATQDVFLKVHKNLKNFHFRSSFKTWIYRITINTAINAYKRKSRHLSHISDCNDAAELGCVEETTRLELDKKSSEELIRSMLETLNPDQRACVVLKDIEGLSYKEIAETLKININTVRSRLKRARGRLMALRQKGGMSNEMRKY